MGRFSGLIGIALIVALGAALSRDRRAIRWSVVAWGLGLQVVFALFVLRVPAGQDLFRTLGLGSPVAWTLGIPWKDCPAIGSLLGTRTVLNEFIACSQLGPLKPTLGFRAMLAGTPANFLSAAIAGILL
ncbi:MAG TPA: Na+ dependent nucleoside transporter N-terminal domain-containing protein [Gemmatimonadales bacterium]|jgi:nucleoside permease NupC